jgi:hypothetical protein
VAAPLAEAGKREFCSQRQPSLIFTYVLTESAELKFNAAAAKNV